MPRGSAVDLLAQLANEDVDRAVAMRRATTPDTLEELVAREHEPADAELRAIAKGLEARYPESQKEWSAGVTQFQSASRDMPVSLYAALLGAVGFVLLIICANVAGLLLARGVERQREIAIRVALGASRRRIVRHLLVESLILSIVGGALGLVVSLWGVELAIWAIGTTPPFYVEIGLNRTSVLFCAATSLFCGLLFGLLPALRASATDVQTTLKDGTTTVKKSVNQKNGRTPSNEYPNSDGRGMPEIPNVPPVICSSLRITR